jgi:hypothetical protein
LNFLENADDFARWLLESYDLDGETVYGCSRLGLLYSWVGLKS